MNKVYALISYLCHNALVVLDLNTIFDANNSLIIFQ